MPRLFVAVDLSVAVVERLTVLRRHLAERAPKGAVRWVKPSNVHVTLKFLGDVDEAMVPLVGQKLGELARPLFPFEVNCCRLGAFPDLERPQILWAGLDIKGAEVMGLLRQTIERDLGELGFAPDDRDYYPHLTLGRVKSADLGDLMGEFKALQASDFGSSYIKDLVLFESRLGPDGAQMIVRARYQLGEQ